MQNNEIGIRVKRLANFVLISGFLGLVVAGECAAESLAVAPSEIGNNSACVNTVNTFAHGGYVDYFACERLAYIGEESAKTFQPLDSSAVNNAQDKEDKGGQKWGDSLQDIHSLLLTICGFLAVIVIQMPSKIK